MNLLFAINHNFTDLLRACLTSVLKNAGADHYSIYPPLRFDREGSAFDPQNGWTQS